VAISEQESLSKAFLDIFAALAYGPVHTIDETPEQILEEINTLYRRMEDSYVQSGSLRSPEGVYTSLRSLINSFTLAEKSDRTVVRILDVYRKSLANRVNVQEVSFEVINRYLDAINEFLEGKKLEITMGDTRIYGDILVRTKFDDGVTGELQTLSSGERQIITLIYTATHMSKQKVVLIDEPEISLHVDWQRLLLRKMAEQLGDRQVIVCTHSPVIAADYGNKMKELKLSYTHKLPLFDTVDDTDLEFDGEGDSL
jgi:predicted ATP-binding protein involved in virulence